MIKNNNNLKYNSSTKDENDQVSSVANIRIPESRDNEPKSQKPLRDKDRSSQNKDANHMLSNDTNIDTQADHVAGRNYVDYFTSTYINAIGQINMLAFGLKENFSSATLEYTTFFDIHRLFGQASIFADAVYSSGIDNNQVIQIKNRNFQRQAYADLYIYSFFKSYLYGYRDGGFIESDLLGYAFKGHSEFYRLLKTRFNPIESSKSPFLSKVFSISEMVHVHNLTTLTNNSYVAAHLYARYVSKKPLLIPFFERMVSKLLMLSNQSDDVQSIQFERNVSQDSAISYRNMHLPIGAFLYDNCLNPGSYNNTLFTPTNNSILTDSFIYNKANFLNFVSYDDNRSDVTSPSFSGVPNFYVRYDLGKDRKRTDLALQAETYFITGIAKPEGRQYNPGEQAKDFKPTGLSLNVVGKDLEVSDEYRKFDYYDEILSIYKTNKDNKFTDADSLKPFIIKLKENDPVLSLNNPILVTLSDDEKEVLF